VEAAKLLTSLPGDIERDVYTGEVARLTGISEEAIKREITKNNKTVRNVNDKRRLNYNLTERNMLLNKGLEEARKAVLFYSSQDEKMCRAILSKLSPVELGEPVYARLLTMLNDCYEKGVSIYPAEIVSRFESPEDQKLVSNVFLTVITPESMEDKLKAVTEHVRQIKASYVDKLMNRPDIDDVELKSLIEEKRNLVKLYISP
jgi:predicted DNA-binding protein YlxM (UPF0122 family)